MQHNYHSTSHQVHLSPPQSPDDYPSPYPDPAHQHAALSYAAVTPANPLPPGSISHHSISPQYPCPPPYATPGTTDDHRSYYVSSSQGSAIDHYPAPSSATTSYASPTSSAQINHAPPRHHTHLSQQQQQQFIPTPSQAYQVFSTAGSASSPRSRSTIEPYYHMSPNPQHIVHAPPASTAHGTGGRSNSAHAPSCSHSHYPHASTHTGTIIVAAGERYPCDRCDRSFTRLHDRRRHYETVHSTSPVLHKCRFCRKDFSRSDSLKRHVDNGCDEMPGPR